MVGEAVFKQSDLKGAGNLVVNRCLIGGEIECVQHTGSVVGKPVLKYIDRTGLYLHH